MNPAVVQRRSVVAKAISAACAELLLSPHFAESPSIFYILLRDGENVAETRELSADELKEFMQRDDVRGLPNLIVRSRAFWPEA